MSSLGITLLILVFVGIGGVIAYNAWMVRREGRSMSSLLQEAPPAIEINRTEPSLDGIGAESASISPETMATPMGESVTHDDYPSEYFGSADAATDSWSAETSDDFEPAIAGEQKPTTQTDADPGARAPIDEGTLADHSTAHAATSSESPMSSAPPVETDPADSADSQLPSEPADDELPRTAAADLRPESESESDHVRHLGVASTEPVNVNEDPSSDGTKELESSLSATDSRGTADDGSDETKDSGVADAAAPDPDHTNRSGTPDGIRSALTENLVPPSGLDRFDCIVNLGPLANVPGRRLIELAGNFNRVGGKPVFVAAIPAGDENIPEPIDGAVRYRVLVLALLLVNRHGPLNAMEYSEYVNRVQSIAEELDVLADVPDMNSVLDHSRALDAEIGALDAQVAVNVISEQVLNPGDLQSLSQKLNLTEQGNNRYVRTGADRQPVFSVSLGDKGNRLVLLLDVPRVAREGLPLREMVECAWKCAQAFEGRMVDDAGQPIDNALFERIERQLDTHYQALQAAGVPAGSSQARRVFN